MTTSTELVTIGRRINDRENAIEILKKQTFDKAADALTEIILQGNDLLGAKSRLNHGQWMTWLDTHCPNISERKAQRYMRVASNPTRVSDLLLNGSMRQALCLEDGQNTEPAKEVKQWPPYLEAIGRLSKLSGYVRRFPIDQWPNEGLEKFRDDLEPIATRLWPDKFKGAGAQSTKTKL
jgi:hypothetical protein